MIMTVLEEFCFEWLQLSIQFLMQKNYLMVEVNIF